MKPNLLSSCGSSDSRSTGGAAICTCGMGSPEVAGAALAASTLRLLKTADVSHRLQRHAASRLRNRRRRADHAAGRQSAHIRHRLDAAVGIEMRRQQLLAPPSDAWVSDCLRRALTISMVFKLHNC